MPAFRFEALDATGKTVNGLVDADNPKAARAQLRTQHMVPLKVSPVQVAESEQSTSTKLFEVAQRNGMKTMREDGDRLVAEGVTSLEEVLRVTRE